MAVQGLGAPAWVPGEYTRDVERIRCPWAVGQLSGLGQPPLGQLDASLRGADLEGKGLIQPRINPSAVDGRPSVQLRES